MNDTDRNVDLELAQDLVMYGQNFWKLVDGKKVRIDPNEIYSATFKRPWYKRWWDRLYWWFVTLRKR